MGDAKRRGTREARVAEAEARVQQAAARHKEQKAIEDKLKQEAETKKLFLEAQEKARLKAIEDTKTPEQKEAEYKKRVNNNRWQPGSPSAFSQGDKMRRLGALAAMSLLAHGGIR